MRIATAIVAAGVLASVVQAGVTTVQKTIGEPGGYSCCGPSSPPTLCDGVTLATATVQFTYDDATRALTLLVANTSPVTPGVPNPLLTSVHFNVPAEAVTGLSLLFQAGSGGAAPAMSLAFDPDPTSPPNPAKLGCLGAFHARLSNGGGIAGAIANPAADTLAAPSGSWVVGPVTFVLDVTTAPGAVLDASDFANAFSHNPPGIHRANLGAKFRAGGPQKKRGTLSTSTGCEPSAFLYGTPSLGGTVTFVMSGAPGCCGCLGFSHDPGPTTFPNIPGWPDVVMPLGDPTFVLIPTTPLPTATTVTVEVAISNVPGLLGRTFHFAVALVDPGTGKLSGSTGSMITIVP